MNLFTPSIPFQPALSGVEDALALLFYFMLYSFGGWVLEQVYSWFTTGTFWKEGFLWGPFKPMYGIAPVLLLLYAERGAHWSTMLLLCFIIPSAVEYISGLMLQKVFYRQWWDYSEYPLQLHGHICLQFSLYWLLLSFAVVHWVHPWVAALYGHLSVVWNMLCPMFMLYFLTDVAWTFWSRRRRGKWMMSNR
ncbi:putative ABC transporter permease [Paenibacillus sp. OSY-SE]|uniref:putative ABC transporter permease n=1 Tax=Paenibacillus sp. OSY-SE TaxID=1196323 RepID=UPI0003027F51|nr:putative ABC transporter permease [Paenibacillus sp. OSY-SE]